VADLPDFSTEEIRPPIHLPSLPALTTLIIKISSKGALSHHLTKILCSIGSAPVLTSIASGSFWTPIEQISSAGPWADVDRWLSQIAKHTKAEGGLLLTLRQWPEGKSVWEAFLPEFRESGGEIKVDYGW